MRPSPPTARRRRDEARTARHQPRPPGPDSQPACPARGRGDRGRDLRRTAAPCDAGGRRSGRALPAHGPARRACRHSQRQSSRGDCDERRTHRAARGVHRRPAGARSLPLLDRHLGTGAYPGAHRRNAAAARDRARRRCDARLRPARRHLRPLARGAQCARRPAGRGHRLLVAARRSRGGPGAPRARASGLPRRLRRQAHARQGGRGAARSLARAAAHERRRARTCGRRNERCWSPALRRHRGRRARARGAARSLLRRRPRRDPLGRDAGLPRALGAGRE
ncbi:unannotated protein [freshwater metagenome]|uniref:Unannotated protein n=1 Tax=freshwater metagenome TaxID=449393 RepID=A0A6J7EMG6_9ZZZZ